MVAARTPWWRCWKSFHGEVLLGKSVRPEICLALEAVAHVCMWWQELARQVSVTCIERGTVLARLWSYVKRTCSGRSVSALTGVLPFCHIQISLDVAAPFCSVPFSPFTPQFLKPTLQGCGADTGRRIPHRRAGQASSARQAIP